MVENPQPFTIHRRGACPKAALGIDSPNSGMSDAGSFPIEGAGQRVEGAVMLQMDLNSGEKQILPLTERTRAISGITVGAFWGQLGWLPAILRPQLPKKGAGGAAA